MVEDTSNPDSSPADKVTVGKLLRGAAGCAGFLLAIVLVAHARGAQLVERLWPGVAIGALLLGAFAGAVVEWQLGDAEDDDDVAG